MRSIGLTLHFIFPRNQSLTLYSEIKVYDFGLRQTLVSAKDKVTYYTSFQIRSSQPISWLRTDNAHHRVSAKLLNCILTTNCFN